jgi:hypothetical protein
VVIRDHPEPLSITTDEMLKANVMDDVYNLEFSSGLSKTRQQTSVG